MAYDGKSLDDYVDVAERIAAFYERYPDGSLQPLSHEHPWEQAVVEGVDKDGQRLTQTFIVYTAAAYRTPYDPRPGVGIAWEVCPGRTPYTRGSEVMNAETSAWGRAIAALGIATRKGIASRQEVRQARDRQDGLPTNVDGTLSRSRTTDEEKRAAGVMTSEQQTEHSALRRGADGRLPAAERGRVVRATSQVDDSWTDQPPGSLPPRVDGGGEAEHQPGSIDAKQRNGLHAAFARIGVNDRANRLGMVAQMIGREVGSSNELSYVEAQTVLAGLGKRTAEPKEATP